MATTPGGISESWFPLQALGSEFFERFQCSKSLEKQFGHVVETGQLIPGLPVRPTHLPFLQVMTPGRMPPSRPVHPAPQVSASGPPEPLRFERRGVSSCRGRRALRRGRGRARSILTRRPSRSSSGPPVAPWRVHKFSALIFERAARPSSTSLLLPRAPARTLPRSHATCALAGGRGGASGRDP